SKDGITPLASKDAPMARAIFQGENVKNKEIILVNRKGDHLPLLCNSAPIRAKNDEIIGGIVTWNDISEIKKAEEILRRDKKTLQKLVKERSEELVEIQVELERSKRLSDIGTLAATVAHELRNPLAGMRLATAYIKKKIGDSTVGVQLDGIDQMITESSQIIDNLLFYSRLKPPQRKVMDLHSLLEECTDTLKQVRITKNIVLSKYIDSLKELPISADPVQIREVFTNILNNAADAIPDHGGEIEVRSRVYHDLVAIHIKDNGHGIAKEDLKKIFEPFFTTKAKGTGLGLTVCGQIVKMHGGSINISSRKGKGTSVIITLPKEEPLKK
ncbi:MAG: ATP-binding protein, partial [Victivallales bacterium]